MIDSRLVRADATRLDELREIMAAQEHSELLCDIGMKAIKIGHGVSGDICDAVRELTCGHRVLLVTGPTLIVDTAGNDIKEKLYKKLAEQYEVDRLVLSEPDSIPKCGRKFEWFNNPI